MNTAPAWKKVFGFIALFLYCSHIYVPLHLPILNTIGSISFIVFVVLMIPEIFRDMKKFKENKKSILWILLGFGLLLVLQAILWQVILRPTIISHLGITLNDGNTVSVKERISKSPVVFPLLCCTFGPILEELLYRYTAFAIIKEKNTFLAYAVSILMFGFQHVCVSGIWGGEYMQLINIFGYFIAGAIFGFVYSKTKNICVSIGSHIMFNTFGMLIMLVTGG